MNLKDVKSLIKKCNKNAKESLEKVVALEITPLQAGEGLGWGEVSKPD